jgi:hypothetical protein
MSEIHDQLRDEMTASQAYYERQVSGRKPSPAYKVGDMVWLNSRNLKTTRPSKKLDHKNLGPFRVSEKVNSRAYRLDLPASMKVHNVFHVSLLHPAADDPFPGQKEIPPPPEVVERDETSEEEFEVEAVQDSRRKGADIEYLVKFKRGQTEWLKWKDVLPGCEMVVQQFHIDNPSKPGPPDGLALLEDERLDMDGDVDARPRRQRKPTWKVIDAVR